MAYTEGFSIDRYYELLKWPDDPGDPQARMRFKIINEYFKKLLSYDSFKGLMEREEVEILDVMGSTGIAGAALLSAITEASGERKKARLTIIDLRRRPLTRARRWLELAKLEGVSLEAITGDAIRIPENVEGKYDVVISWGSSLPHLSVQGRILVLAGSRDVSKKDGLLILDQYDLLPGILFSNNYQRVMVEGEALTIHKGYDPMTGWIDRIVYDARTMLYQGIVRTRLWEMATVLGYLWIFYEDVIVDKILEEGRIRTVIAGLGPRENAPGWKELWEARSGIKRLEGE